MYKKQKQDKSQETILGIWCISIPQNSDNGAWRNAHSRDREKRIDGHVKSR